MTSTTRYRQAAITYLIYGIIYFSGAAYITAIGMTRRGFEGIGGYIFFGIALMFLIAFPILIWRENKWFTRILSIVIGYRIFELFRIVFGDSDKMVPVPGGAEISMQVGAGIFLVVALVTMGMLIRAGWQKDIEALKH